MGTWKRRALLVEDVQLTGSFIESFLVSEGFEVVRCPDAASARNAAQDFDADVAILDVNLGEGMNGIQLGYILEQSHPAMAIMYLTQYPAAFVTESGSAAHLRNKVVLSKDDVKTPADLLHAIESALRGYQTGMPEITDERISALTCLHWQILEMMADGMTNAAIAQRRGTSERAVEKQLKAIYENLGIKGDDMTNARVIATRRFLQIKGDSLPSYISAEA